MSIRLEHELVAILMDVPLKKVSRVEGELLMHFARHANTATGDIFINNGTLARESRSP